MAVGAHPGSISRIRKQQKRQAERQPAGRQQAETRRVKKPLSADE
jgi:hypothetical protein